MTPSLGGRVVVVTGAARGMGRSFVEGFLAQGCKVVALDRSWEPSGASNDTDGSWMGNIARREDVLAVTCDITSEAAVSSALEQSLARFGTVDALCNNAGLLQRNLFPPGGPVRILDTTNEDFRRMYDVNVFGTLLVTRAFARPMIAQRRGSIFSVISSGVLMRERGGAFEYWRPESREQPYMSSKAALANLMGYLADELRDDNVAVNSFVPMHARSTGYDEWADAREKGRGSRGTAPYHPDHVQPLGCFLAAQDAASGNTGRIWVAATWLTAQGYELDRWLAPDPL